MGRFSVKKRLRSFIYAGRGIKSFITKEHNAWIHCSATILVIIFGIALDIFLYEWIAVLICIGMVFALEAVNTAIERAINLVSPQYNKMAGDVKDIAAGAVLVFCIIAAIVGGIIFIPKLISVIWG